MVPQECNAWGLVGRAIWYVLMTQVRLNDAGWAERCYLYARTTVRPYCMIVQLAGAAAVSFACSRELGCFRCQPALRPAVDPPLGPCTPRGRIVPVHAPLRACIGSGPLGGGVYVCVLGGEHNVKHHGTGFRNLYHGRFLVPEQGGMWNSWFTT